MDFSFTKQQRDIKKAAAEFAAKEFLPEVAQEHERNHRYPQISKNGFRNTKRSWMR